VSYRPERKCLVTRCAPWFPSLKEPISIAQWIAYAIERALWIQFYVNVKDQFDLDAHIFVISPEKQYIKISKELKEFWNSYR